MITVRNLLQSKGSHVWTIAPQAGVLEALELMTGKDIGALPVVDDGLVGIISERDIVQMLASAKAFYPLENIQHYMTRELITTHPDASVEECMAMMTNYHVRHLPVLENEKLVGLVSIGDVVKALITDRDGIITDLEDYIAGRSERE